MAIQMMSVDKMFLMVDTVKREIDDEMIIEKPPIFWPVRPEIVFENVSLKYSENTKLALKNVSFIIKAGAKVCYF